MDKNQGLIGMALGSWIVGALAGALAAVLLWLLGGWGFMQGAFIGALVALIGGGLISWLMTRPLPAPGEVKLDAAPVSATPPAPAANPGAKAPSSSKAAGAGAADDLKLIGGVGPALEKKLNSAGITRFEQIANMSAEDVEKVEEQLSFKGRMERDDWRGQAKILAAGGETEFSKKNSKT